MRDLNKEYLEVIDPNVLFGDMDMEEFLSWLYTDEYGGEQVIPIYVPNLISILYDNGFEEFMDMALEEYREHNFI